MFMMCSDQGEEGRTMPVGLVPNMQSLKKVKNISCIKRIQLNVFLREDRHREYLVSVTNILAH